MLSAEDRSFLESWCALIVGTVGPDGEPFATRAWGLDVLDDGRLRLLLDGDDEGTLANLAVTGAIAITAADVTTLHSSQLKGAVVAIEAADERDAERARRYCDVLFADIHTTDGTAYEVLERWVPSRYAACTCVVEAWFDQTPGPDAGAKADRVAPRAEVT